MVDSAGWVVTEDDIVRIETPMSPGEENASGRASRELTKTPTKWASFTSKKFTPHGSLTGNGQRVPLGP